MISGMELLRLNVIACSDGTSRGFRSGLVGGRIMGDDDETTLGSSRNFSTSDAKWNRGISMSEYAPTIVSSGFTLVPSPRLRTFFSARVRSREAVLIDSILGVAVSEPISCIDGLRTSPSRDRTKRWAMTSGGSTLSVKWMNPKSSPTGGLPGTGGAGFSEGVGDAGAAAATAFSSALAARSFLASSGGTSLLKFLEILIASSYGMEYSPPGPCTASKWFWLSLYRTYTGAPAFPSRTLASFCPGSFSLVFRISAWTAPDVLATIKKLRPCCLANFSSSDVSR